MPITPQDVRKLARKDLSARQHRQRVNLLGVGGVGTNVLRQALRNDEQFLFRIYDHDTLELHNLNRSSLFLVQSVGQKKVVAVRTAVRHRFGERSGSTPHRTISFLRENQDWMVDRTSTIPGGTIIDARDTMDPTKMVAKTWLKLAYNGGSELSFTWRPDLVADRVLDLGGRSAYEVVPSFYVPAAVLAVFALHFMRLLNFAEIPDTRAGTYQLDLDQAVREVSYRWTPADVEQTQEAA